MILILLLVQLFLFFSCSFSFAAQAPIFASGIPVVTITELPTPTIPAGTLRFVSDSNDGSCDTAGGALGLLVLCVDTGTEWQTANFIISSETIDSVFDRSNDGLVTGTNESKPFGIRGTGSGTNFGWDFFTDSLNVPQFKCVISGVRDNCNYYRSVGAGKKAGFADSLGNVDFEYDEANNGISRLTGSGAAEVRGDILFRGTSVWSRLAAGTAGLPLTTNGVGADPSFTALKTQGASNALKDFTKNINILSPATSQTNKIQVSFGKAVSLQEVGCSTDVGTVTIQLDKRTETTPNTAGTNAMTSSLVCDSDRQETTSFASAGVSTSQILNLQISATASAPTVVRIHILARADNE